jgi:2-oxoglutarate dehydrogenase E2 component (dihydrolipoamide succinyltransferase)
MPIIEMLMPKMGESIMEATVLTWLKKVGESIAVDESILEVATDKIDTEVPAIVSGILHEILIKEGEIAEIGKPICKISTEGGEVIVDTKFNDKEEAQFIDLQKFTKILVEKPQTKSDIKNTISDRFYSPLVLTIAEKENVSQAILDTLIGTGEYGRVTKNDILEFVKKQKQAESELEIKIQKPIIQPALIVEATDEVIPMDRMRTMIAERMKASMNVAAHVTSYVDCDMTDIVNWRNNIKDSFSVKYGENITFTPILIQAVVLAIKDFPMMNVQVNGNQIIKKGNINIGMAVALPNGNLIVPVIHKADKYRIVDLSKKVNDLSKRAREGALKPEDLEGGTFTVSNIGTFGNIMGTPILVQPQVGILAFGAIQKTPCVISKNGEDAIAIRHKMYISHSYDHRVVDGSLGGQFVKRVADYLENFNETMINLS